jgi:hypothetical protein
MTALNGLIRTWDAFIQTICARKEKLHFGSLWEECVQKEATVDNREALLSRDEDQALATHTKGGRKRSYFQKETHKESQPQNKFIHKESHPPRRFQKFQKCQRREKYFSSYQCYHTKGGRKRSYFQKETHKESQPQKKIIHKESHPPRRF